MTNEYRQGDADPCGCCESAMGEVSDPKSRNVHCMECGAAFGLLTFVLESAAVATAEALAEATQRVYLTGPDWEWESGWALTVTPAIEVVDPIEPEPCIKCAFAVAEVSFIKSRSAVCLECAAEVGLVPAISCDWCMVPVPERRIYSDLKGNTLCAGCHDAQRSGAILLPERDLDGSHFSEEPACTTCGDEGQIWYGNGEFKAACPDCGGSAFSLIAEHL